MFQSILQQLGISSLDYVVYSSNRAAIISRGEFFMTAAFLLLGDDLFSLDEVEDCSILVSWWFADYCFFTWNRLLVHSLNTFNHVFTGLFTNFTDFFTNFTDCSLIYMNKIRKWIAQRC